MKKAEVTEEKNIHTREYSASSRLCDTVLNSPKGRRSSVQCLKTFGNNPDAVLTTREKQTSRVSVYVLNMRGQPLMPCKPRKARKLLEAGKARVVNRTPFTIQLKYPTGETKQPITLGIDSGFEKIGLSAVSDAKELYSSEIWLRKDIVKLISEKRTYRRTRRSRKIWYRKPRFLNRGNAKKGWLAPSIRNKVEAHIKAVKQIKEILPISKIIVEVASFDIQKIKDPEIKGKDYQRGEQLNFFNVREYVLHRDRHICRSCKGRSKDKILNIHHLVSRQIGGDRPENLITLCKTCHEKIHNDKLKQQPEKLKNTGFRAETFMTIVRWRLVEYLRKFGGEVLHTYGYFTKMNRIAAGLEKSHINDAFIIAGGSEQIRSIKYLIRQVRKCNRKLFKGARSHIRNTAARFIQGFQRFDKVLWKGTEGFIFGRTSKGYCALRKLDGTVLHKSARLKDCKLLESARTFLMATFF